MPDHPRDPNDPQLDPSHSLESHDAGRLSDGRESLSAGFERPVPRDDRAAQCV
jgi:hypothetical protein